MSHELFHPDDIFINRVKAYPDFNFFIYNSDVIINGHQNLTGTVGGVSTNVLNVPKGYVSLFEMNINRDGDFIYPFLTQSGVNYKQTFRTKDGFNSLVGSRTFFGGTANCNIQTLAVAAGDFEAGSYPMSASITRTLSTAIDPNTLSFDSPIDCSPTNFPTLWSGPPSVNFRISALQTTARKYTPLSKHFVFVASGPDTPLYTYSGVRGGIPFEGGAGFFGNSSPNEFLSRDLTTSTVNIINVPSIFYGSSIKKGSVELKYFITGTLIAACKDENQNGELIGTFGETSGSVVGICMYDEGLLLLTSSTALDSGNGINYDAASAIDASWLYYGTTCNDGLAHSTLASASYNLALKGTSYTSTLTMFCHAEKGRYNYSNNPTYLNLKDASGSISSYVSGANSFSENSVPMHNIVSSSFYNAEEEYRKTTYLSKIGIYDDKDNLIAVASLAQPIKKTEEDDYTFKLTLDI